jgi:hypothetical protein
MGGKMLGYQRYRLQGFEMEEEVDYRQPRSTGTFFEIFYFSFNN